jgi:hypothetical protein
MRITGRGDEMYPETDCRADHIVGMERQRDEAKAALNALPANKKIMYVNGLEGSDQIYCQANFVFGFGEPFKFCRNVQYLLSERYFERLIEKTGAQQLVFADRPTFEWFRQQPQYAAYTGICMLLPNATDAGPEFALTVHEKTNLFTRWKNIREKS